MGPPPSPQTEHSGSRLAQDRPLSRSERLSAHTSSPVPFKKLSLFNQKGEEKGGGAGEKEGAEGGRRSFQKRGMQKPPPPARPPAPAANDSSGR